MISINLQSLFLLGDRACPFCTSASWSFRMSSSAAASQFWSSRSTSTYSAKSPPAFLLEMFKQVSGCFSLGNFYQKAQELIIYWCLHVVPSCTLQPFVCEQCRLKKSVMHWPPVAIGWSRQGDDILFFRCLAASFVKEIPTILQVQSGPVQAKWHPFALQIWRINCAEHCCHIRMVVMCINSQ